MTDGPVPPPAQRGSALEPLRARYAHWLGLDQAQVAVDREEAAADIRAMQLVLRMERTDPPSWHRALSAAASGAAALCLDPRSEPGGEWQDAIAAYCRGHIRKVTRRARGAHWLAAQELPGITIDLQGTQVRVLVPGLVSELDPRIGRLQVGGTDVEPDAPPDHGVTAAAGAPDARVADAAAQGVDRLAPDRETAAEAPSLRVWLAPTPPMTLGKAMAQAGHAGMISAALLAGTDQQVLTGWADAQCPAAARRASAQEWAQLTAAMGDQARAWSADRLLAVRDAGFTEVAPGTITVIGQVVSRR